MEDIITSELNWDSYFINLIYQIAKKSKDPSTKVGCVIVDSDHRIKVCGYNGFPKGVDDLKSRYEDRNIKYSYIVHAETAAIFSAAKSGVSINSCTLYVPWLPCNECAKGIISSGIKEVVIDSNYKMDDGLRSRWGNTMELTKIMFSETGVVVRGAG